MKYGSLCSGYGGLERGVQAVLGGTTAWHVEYDTAPSKILAHHYPNVPNYGDLTKVDWLTVEPIQVMTAGYPCQPFSHAGKRAGTDDERHLWPYIAHAVGILRPQLCVFENVRGHLSLGFDEAVRDLHLLDYDVQWHLARASDAGAPHGRARLFIFAEDKHSERILGRPDRRRGMHRDSGGGRLLAGALEGHHDGQGAVGATDDATTPRRKDRRPPEATERPGAGVVHLAVERLSGGDAALRTAIDVGREGGSCGRRLAVSGNGGLSSSAAERRCNLDSRDAGSGRDADPQDSGSQPQGTGPGATAAATGQARSGLPVGVVVGAGGGSVRPCGVHWPHSHIRDDGRGTHVRASDAGAPHGRFRVFIYAWPATGDSYGAGGWECVGPGEARRAGGGSACEARATVRGVTGRSGGAAPSDADRLGHERTRRTRGRRGGPTDSGIPTPDATGDGRHEGRTQPTRLIGRPDAALGGDAAPADTDDWGRTDAADHPGGTRSTRGGGTSGEPTPRRTAPRARSSSAVDWGKYEPAIRRWENVTGRLAPAPTEPGKNGAARLSPAFVEWMMGLPAGHVTAVPGLSRNDQLKALGNGCVPQQVASATRLAMESNHEIMSTVRPSSRKAAS